MQSGKGQEHAEPNKRKQTNPGRRAGPGASTTEPKLLKKRLQKSKLWIIEDAPRGRTTARPPLVATCPLQQTTALNNCGQTSLAYFAIWPGLSKSIRNSFGGLKMIISVLEWLEGVARASGAAMQASGTLVRAF